MRVLFCRHAEAVDPSEAGSDAARWLTSRGRETQARVGRWMRESREIRITRVVTSPLVRAVQSGEILGEVHGVGGVREARARLSEGPSAAIAGLPLELFDPDETLAVVGHEPLIRTAAGQLLGSALPGFRTAGACLLELAPDGTARLEWMLDPHELDRG